MTDLHSPLALAQALLRCPSVTPDDAGSLDLLQDWLTSLGFSCHRQTFALAGSPPVDNLFARIGSTAPHLSFAGHVDVVPAGDEAAWSQPPFAAVIENGLLYGRGAVDMKGAIACMVAAFARSFSSLKPPSGSFSFIITADEEKWSINGTEPLLAWMEQNKHTPDFCLVGEPTNPQRLGDAIKIGRRGSLSGTLTALGVQGHVAYPHLARNPITLLRRLLDALDAAPLDGGDENFEPSNLEIVSVDVGNPSFNVIPQRAAARFNIRFNAQHMGESLKALLRERLTQSGIAAEHYELGFESPVAPAFLTRPDSGARAEVDALVKAIATQTGQTPQFSTNGGTSDARFIQAYCPVVEFGLVGQTMHKTDECVAVQDLETLTQIYQGWLRDILQA